MLEIYAVKQKGKLDDSKCKKIMSYLPDETRIKINKFIRWEDRQRQLIANALIRSVICKNLNLKSNEIIFGRGDYGKPYLKNRTDFKFNLSDSGEWVVCAISDKEIGIDVEEVRPIELKMAERFFSKSEYESLMSKNNEERIDYFYDLWTLKESYIKATGKGLSLPLGEFTIHINKTGLITLETNVEDGQYDFSRYKIDKGYKLSICVADKIKNEKLILRSCRDPAFIELLLR